jgi:Flp pilus assembly protein TadD
LKKAETLEPNSPYAHNNLGVVLERLGKHEEALKHFSKAVKAKPDYGEAICNLALNYLEKGNRDAAYQQLRSLEKIDLALADELRKVMWSKYTVNVSKKQ